MTYETERRALQRVVAVAGLVPVLGGLYGVLFGQAGLGGGAFDVSTDSHFRYLSGLLLGIGLCSGRRFRVSRPRRRCSAS